MEFDWDPAKRVKNLEEHDVDFQDMKPLFESAGAYLDKEDDREDYGEERRIRLGFVEGLPFFVVYTMHGEVTWIISARMAEPAEEKVLVAEIEGEKSLQQSKWEQDQTIERKKQEERTRIESRKEREER